jgi:CBS-domain-containing membrane protein
MTCATIMNPHPVTIGNEETVAAALEKMLQHRVKSLAVVDREGRFQGMFGLHRLLGLLLPKAATISDGMEDLAFVSDTLTDIRERLQQLQNQPVGAYLSRNDTVPVHPGTPLVETVLLLYRHRDNLPVVEQTTGKLVGLVSPWEILAKLQSADRGERI